MSSGDCERLRPYLVDYVVGELEAGAEQRAELERHLNECAACRSAADSLRGTGKALEAIRESDTRLNPQVRRNISEQAKLESEKLREARDRGRAAAASPLASPIPAAAWMVLGLGTAVVLIGAWLLPRLDVGGRRPAARVISCSGSSLGTELSRGAAISLPAESHAALELSDGSILELLGPAEAALAGPSSPLKLIRGSAWLRAARPVSVELLPLRSLDLPAGAEAALTVRPAEDEAVLVTVMVASARYSAASGKGEIPKGQTLAVRNGSGAAAARPCKETETAPWHKTPSKAPRN